MFVRQLPETRLAKLRDDRRREVRYDAQRRAISKALELKGRKMFKVMGRAAFKLDDRYQTPVYYEAEKWVCHVETYQKLINKAIAGI